MWHEGVHYIGRGTQLFLSEELERHTVRNMFTAGWQQLDARISARVRSINRVQVPDEPNIVVLTDVRIGVKDTADVEYFATISFAQVSW